MKMPELRRVYRQYTKTLAVPLHFRTSSYSTVGQEIPKRLHLTVLASSLASADLKTTLSYRMAVSLWQGD